MIGLADIGFFWHVHHSEELIEYCYSYEERLLYIRTQKEASEQKLRLRLFKKVQGMLPDEVIRAGQACENARQACNRAWPAYYKAIQLYRESEGECVKEGQACYRAEQIYNKAWQTFREAKKACDQATRDNMHTIMTLHEQECPNCPWDGHTIFPDAA